MLNIYFIAGHGENFRRLPEFLQRPDVRIILICCSTSLLRKSAFIDEVITISRHPQCATFAESLIGNQALLSNIDGWVIFANDDDLHKVAHSELELELKLKLLPVHNPDFFRILGSKAALVTTCIDNEVPIPKSVVVENPESLRQQVMEFPTPFVLKGDEGASGTKVKIISDEPDFVLETIPTDWYPIVIQQFIKGELCGVEAFFREGQLLAWMYSYALKSLPELGPSVIRRYVDPPVLDFVIALEKFGKATGAHGFASCSFFYLPEKNQHFTFEIDLRTNAWHHLGGMFGLDWIKMMIEPLENLNGILQHPTSLPSEGLILTHWQRHITFALLNREWKTVIRLLLIPKRKRYPISYRDSPLTKAQLRSLFSLAIIAVAQSLFHLLPAKLKKNLKEHGATARFVSIIAQH